MESSLLSSHPCFQQLIEAAATPRKQAKALMKKILCPEGARTEDCYHRSCSDCRHLRGDLEEEIEAIFQANSISSVLFEKWTTQDRTEVKTFNVPPGDFAKLVKKFIDDHKTIELKSLAYKGKELELSEIKKLASLPSREQALAQLMSVMQAPIQKLLSTMNAVPSKMVRTLDAVKQSKN